MKLKFAPDEATALGILRSIFIRGAGEESEQVREAVRDGYKRLLVPSLETELRNRLKERADGDAIRVFSQNLHALLMASPFGGRRILAVDPGFRSGCKVVALDESGRFLTNETIYPHPPQNRGAEAQEIVVRLVESYRPEAIAVGNGTAGRETVAWLGRQECGVPVVSVNESGASVYSASETARKEFPDLDLTVRGAVSIGRRLQDPLAELVKIDPKSIGVGQYQHDVDHKKLCESLDDVVIGCVNRVGVDVNNASRELLRYVSGLNGTLAENIVKYRDANGPFRARADLHHVPRLGPKAFEQAAGFLRIRGGMNPLDASAVHPENYALVERMASDLGRFVGELMKDPACLSAIDVARYPEAGQETMRDILAELAKPGRDPREVFEPFAFDPNVEKPEDLKTGMCLPGLVSNVTDFGVFVDVGVHLDGLLHVSRLKKRKSALKPGDRVDIEVLSVDLARNRISLGLATDLPDAGKERKSAATASGMEKTTQ